jgi:hypothetical protein
MCQSGPYQSLAFLGDRPAAIFALQARRGPTFIWNGTDDTVVAIPQHGPDFFEDLRRRTIALNGSDGDVFTTYFDPGASHRPAWVTPAAAKWLARQLHFANWSAKKIGKLPTIRIADWAAAKGVSLNRSAMREDRDGGLRALDVDAPKLTPEQLSVLPMAEWERERVQFVYASWAADAIAAAKRAGTPDSSAAPATSVPWALASAPGNRAQGQAHKPDGFATP